MSRARWQLSLYPEAAEGGGCFVPSTRPAPRGWSENPPDTDRSRHEAAKRAKGKARRYCAANRLNRLGTLTYDGDGCHDPRQLRADLGEFFRALRAGLGGKPLPYMWVPEWHKSHGLHGHFALGRYVPRGLIASAWGWKRVPGRGFVHIKRLGDLPVGSGSLEEARRAAGYLSKYVSKSFDERRVPGLHRYEVAQGFQPRVTRLTGTGSDDVIEKACAYFGGVWPEYIWRSAESEDWQGPPSIWASWPG